VPDIPILNNIKGKVIPFLHKHQESFEEESEIVKSPGQPTADLTASNNDVLRQFRIKPETELNDDILTPSKIAKVRFRESSPKGFSFTDVEQFHNDVSRSLQWYIKALEQRDKDVHRLATEIDKYITDYQNLRFEIEVLQSSGGQAVVDGDGNYVTESQLSNDQRQIIELEKSIENLNNRIIATDKELSDLRTKHNETLVRNEVLEGLAARNANTEAAATFPTSGKTDEEIAVLEEELAVYRQWEKDVTIAYEELETSIQHKDEEIASLAASLEELKANPLVVEPEPIVIQAEPVIIENREELDAANERIRLLEESNEQFKLHISELDKYIDVLETSINEASEEDDTEEEESTVAFSENTQIEQIQHPISAPKIEDAPQIIKGIDLGNLPPGIRPDDLF
jgi:chromosome segregation ATPase